MFKIQDDIIYLTRGDTAAIELEIENYTFQPDDVVRFAVYGKKEMDKKAYIEKEVTVEVERETVVFSLSSEDTKIGVMANKPIEYWFEFELNGDQTVLGYDELGAKKLILFPEGVEDIEQF